MAEILSRTQALCPVCMKRLPALRERRGDAVWLIRQCPEHGPFEAVIWRGAPSFELWRREKTPSRPLAAKASTSRGCPYDCGLCAAHGQHTCTAVVEVTRRCNLRCPVCYACANGPGGETPGAESRDPSVPELAACLELLRQTAGRCNLQLSGGEPTCRDDLPEIIAQAAPLGFGLVQVNTNGLRLAEEPGYAERLAEAGLQSVFLQFDGPDEACQVLRGRPLMAEKLSAIDACGRAGLGVVLVPTLARGVNDGALGMILATALAHAPVVRGIHMQPMSGFGRVPKHLAPAEGEDRRITLPEALALLVAQSGGMLRSEDFHPPCCEHERCSFSARYIVEAGGRLKAMGEGGCCDQGPLQASEGARRAKASVAGQWATAPNSSPTPPRDDFERFLAARSADKRLSISCMAFQDALTLDLERVRGCCIHTQAPDGRLIPFCLYNLTALDGTPLYREVRP